MMTSDLTRRSFLGGVALAGGALALGGKLAFGAGPAPRFEMTLQEWSLHRRILGPMTWADAHVKFGAEGVQDKLRNAPDEILQGMSNLDFPRVAVEEFGLTILDYVNAFFYGKAEDTAYLTRLRDNVANVGATSNMIMVDREGRLGEPGAAARRAVVEAHYKWVDAAAFLGCKLVRVNAASDGSAEAQRDHCADGLSRLADYGAQNGIGIIVENHGGLSSNAAWLASVMQAANHANLGTLPDFGNFHIDADTDYDPYQGVAELMPYARAVSAKSYDFDTAGNETRLDYKRLMNIVLESGFKGYVGIEYEGERLSEAEGILKTRALLERFRF